MSDSPKKPLALLAAMDTQTINLLFKEFSFELQTINSENDFEAKLEYIGNTHFDIVICGDLLGREFLNEFGQVCRQNGSQIPIYSLSSTKNSFEPTLLKKNGFSDAFIWPVDQSLIAERILDASRTEMKSEKFLKPIFVADLDANSQMPFETFVHLPLNKRFLRFSSKDSALGPAKMNRLKEKDFGKLFIDKKNMNTFYEYTATSLKGGPNANVISQTERNQKIVDSVRSLFNSLFDLGTEAGFDTGKEFLTDTQKVISQYVTNGKTKNWYSQLINSFGSGLNSYDHAATVSSTACLIAIGIGYPKPEDLALAGFFHDLGRADFPEELLEQEMSHWPKERVDEYKMHPQTSVNLLKQKKMVIGAEVEKAILQHHEKFAGGGFPKQLSGSRISQEAQILSLADQIAYHMTPRHGRPRLTPIEVLEEIKKNESIGPEVLLKVEALFRVPKSPN